MTRATTTMMLSKIKRAYRAFFENPDVAPVRALSQAEPAMFRPHSRRLVTDIATTTPALVEGAMDDAMLVQRIIGAYHRAQALAPDTGSFWSNHFGGLKAPVHEILMRGNVQETSRALRNPAGNNLFYGFDGPYLDGLVDGDIDILTRQVFYDRLSRLAEAFGAIRTYYPEAPIDPSAPLPSVDYLIDEIEQQFGGPILFPNIYPFEQGLPSSRGIITWRPLQALYQAYMIVQATPTPSSRKIVEIGAGLGRNAFYIQSIARAVDYTIVDLPLTNVAQAYFLGRTVGEERIALLGEHDQNRPIKIMPPDAFYQSNEAYDLAFNADSFTEMSVDAAADYIEELSKRCPKLLSINHEFNIFTINELCSKRGWQIVERNPYWMRQGYVQELILL